jgi:hypothetical protein
VFDDKALLRIRMAGGSHRAAIGAIVAEVTWAFWRDARIRIHDASTKRVRDR